MICRRLQIAGCAVAQVLVALQPAKAAVIHTHGLVGIHLHFLSEWDLSKGAAESPSFNHSRSGRGQVEVDSVNVLAVVLNATFPASSGPNLRGPDCGRATELWSTAVPTPTRELHNELFVKSGPLGHPPTIARSLAALLMTSHAILL